MKEKIVLACAALALLVFATAAVAYAAGGAPEPRVVKVRGNYFAPDRLTVPKYTKIVWRWPSSPGDVHDVRLTQRPEGVKRFNSKLAASDFSFARTLKKAGKYTMVCTIHAGMQMTVKVRR